MIQETALPWRLAFRKALIVNAKNITLLQHYMFIHILPRLGRILRDKNHPYNESEILFGFLSLLIITTVLYNKPRYAVFTF